MTSLGLGSDASLPWLRPVMVVFSEGHSVAESVVKQRVCTYWPVKRRRIAKVQDIAGECSDDKRTRVLYNWTALLDADPEASRVGRQILSLQDETNGRQLFHEMLEDVFAAKATGAQDQRAGSLLMSKVWFDK